MAMVKEVHDRKCHHTMADRGWFAGAIPIPGCKTVPQVQEHVGAMGWRLDSNEVAIIDEKLQSM